MPQSNPELQGPYKAALIAAGRDYLKAAGTEGAVMEVTGLAKPCVIVLGDETHVCALLRDPSADQVPGGRRAGDPPPAKLNWEEPMPGAPRKWTILLTSEGHGLVNPLGSTFEHAHQKHERVDVVELAPFVDQLATALQQNANHLEEVHRLREKVAELQAAASERMPRLNADELARLRRVMRGLDLDDKQWDDEQASDLLCTMLGIVAGHLEARKRAAKPARENGG